MGKSIGLIALSGYQNVGVDVSAQRLLESRFLACQDPEAFVWDEAYLPKDGNMNFYTDQPASKHANFFGYQTNEPGTKSIISRCQGKLDVLIILASQITMKKVYNESGEKGTGMKYGPCLQNVENHFRRLIVNQNEEPGSCKNTFDFYISQIRHYISHIKNGQFPEVYVLEIEDAPSGHELNQYCFWIARLLMDLVEGTDTKLYLDTNGGPRETMAVMIGTLRLISQYPLQIECALYSAFTKNKVNSYYEPFQIYDRKTLYNFFDLVSGLDDFLSVGHSRRLIHYFKSLGKPLSRALEEVQNVSRAFSMCQPKDMIQAVNAVAVELKKEQKRWESGSSDDGLYWYVIDEIRKDFGDKILNAAEIDSPLEDMLIPIMEWALKKDYVQQVITLFAEKMPDVLVGKRILYYVEKKDENVQLWIEEDLNVISDNENDKKYNFIQKYLCLPTHDKNKKFNICHQSLFKRDKHPRNIGNIEWKQVQKQVRNQRVKQRFYDNTAYVRGLYIERVLKWQLSNAKLPECQKLHTDLKPWETAEIMREYYSIKVLRNNVNHANTDTKQNTASPPFNEVFTSYKNYDDIKRYLAISIENVHNAIQIIQTKDRSSLRIVEMESQFTQT